MPKDAEKRIAELEKEVSELKDLLKRHHHTGLDGTDILRYTQDIDPLAYFRAGKAASFSGVDQTIAGSRVIRAGMIAGTDTDFSDGSDNTQVTIEHQPDTDGSTNQSFMWGVRGPLFTGNDGNITSGKTLLTQKTFSFKQDALIGAIMIVTANDGTTYFTTITDNTERSITVDSAWSATQKNCQFDIGFPVYLGNGSFPWRRAYVMEDTTGGVRFGLGATNDGNNGLLFMSSSDGHLYWRRPDGTTSARLD